jgi:hypothetical protein
MRMIPWLALVLIVANLGFCAWTQGGFGGSLPPPGAAQREPERLRQQVRPESVVVLSPKAASAALAQIAATEAAASAAAGVATGASASGVVQTLPGSNQAAPPRDSAADRTAPARPR